MSSIEYKIKPYSNMLRQSRNIIFRGAPGTGKSYLAKEIASDIISKGRTTSFESLTDDEKKQIEFAIKSVVIRFIIKRLKMNAYEEKLYYLYIEN